MRKIIQSGALRLFIRHQYKYRYTSKKSWHFSWNNKMAKNYINKKCDSNHWREIINEEQVMKQRKMLATALIARRRRAYEQPSRLGFWTVSLSAGPSFLSPSPRFFSTLFILFLFSTSEIMSVPTKKSKKGEKIHERRWKK